MKKSTGVDLSESKFKRVAGAASKEAQTKRKEMDQRAPSESPENTLKDKQVLTMVIEIDAWNLRGRDHWGETRKIRKKGEEVKRWHWAWTGTVFTLDQRVKKGQRIIIVERGYVATREGVDSFWEQLHAEAMRRGLGQVGRVLIIADGAAWIWNLAEDRFPEAVQRRDLYHLQQHLWTASLQIHEDRQQAYKWQERMKKILAKGQAIKVIKKMEDALTLIEGERRKALEKEISYFTTHKERMDCDQGHCALLIICLLRCLSR